MLRAVASILSCLVVTVSALTDAGQAAPLPEYKVKAALLYKFTKFVEWPTQAFAKDTSPLRLCVLGDDPFGTALDAVSGNSVRGREISVRRATAIEDVSDGCHVVFVSRSEARRVKPILGALSGLPVLTVSDVQGFARRGGVIDLINENNRIRFEINVEASKAHGLEVSSQLLELAIIVQDNANEDAR